MTIYRLSKTQYQRWLHDKDHIIVHLEHPMYNTISRCFKPAPYMVGMQSEFELCGRCAQIKDA